MKKTIIWILIIIVVIIGLVVWANSGSAPAYVGVNDQSMASSSDETAMSPVVVLATASTTDLGTFLTDTRGMTLYMYTKDSVGTTTCYGQCAVMWPPYMVEDSSVSLSGGTEATGTVSTITRLDGGSQVTYGGLPLYYWYKDVKAGDTLGQNVGKVWFVVKP